MHLRYADQQKILGKRKSENVNCAACDESVGVQNKYF